MSWTLPSWFRKCWWGRRPGRWIKQHWLWRDGWSCHWWFRHWGAFWFYQWNWASTLYAERGTTDQQRHCCIPCCRPLTWSRYDDPCRCIYSNALPQDIKHFHLNSILLPYIFGQLQSVQRLDFVWDVYLADSLKAGTKSKRGQGQRSKVLHLAPLPSTWKSFLKNDENKSDLFCFLSERKKGENSSFSQNTRPHLR